MNVEKIKSAIREFRDARDWMQFHNPKNMAISISLEASELLEHFQWTTPEESETVLTKKRSEIESEIADIAIYLIEFCDNSGIDLEKAILEKLQENDRKYPAEKAKGSAKKYTEL